MAPTTALGAKSRELTQSNPWWRASTGWEARDPDLRQVAGSGLSYRPEALDDLQAGSLYVLRGPRRVGKTVATKQAIVALLGAGVQTRRWGRVRTAANTVVQISKACGCEPTVGSNPTATAFEQVRCPFLDHEGRASSSLGLIRGS